MSQGGLGGSDSGINLLACRAERDGRDPRPANRDSPSWPRNRPPREPHEREARTVARQAALPGRLRSLQPRRMAIGRVRTGSRFLAASSVTISTLIEARPSRFEGCLTASLPAFVCFYPLGGGHAAFVGDENPLLPRAYFLLNVEPQGGGIPPYDGVAAGCADVKPGRNRCLRASATLIGPIAHRVVAEWRAARSESRRPPLVPDSDIWLGSGPRATRQVVRRLD